MVTDVSTCWVEVENEMGVEPSHPLVKWVASCEKGPDDIFCPFLVLSVFAHLIPQIT